MRGQFVRSFRKNKKKEEMQSDKVNACTCHKQSASRKKTKKNMRADGEDFVVHSIFLHRVDLPEQKGSNSDQSYMVLLFFAVCIRSQNERTTHCAVIPCGFLTMDFALCVGEGENYRSGKPALEPLRRTEETI